MSNLQVAANESFSKSYHKNSEKFSYVPSKAEWALRALKESAYDWLYNRIAFFYVSDKKPHSEEDLEYYLSSFFRYSPSFYVACDMCEGRINDDIDYFIDLDEGAICARCAINEDWDCVPVYLKESK